MPRRRGATTIAALRARCSGEGITIEVPKTGLPTYDALRAYGVALGLEALAVVERILSFPRIDDLGATYELKLPTRDPLRPPTRDPLEALPKIMPRSHGVLALLRSLGSEDPGRAARELGEVLRQLLREGSLQSRGTWTLHAVVEPAAVKAPRGGSRLRLQRRGEMLDQMRRPADEGVVFAYLAAWGLASRPCQSLRWVPERGLFACARQEGGHVVRLLPLPTGLELRHERDPAALADAAVWPGSERGSACHMLILLALRGGLGAQPVLVDRLRPTQGGRWQPVAWGIVRAPGIEGLASSVAGYTVLEGMGRVFNRAREQRSGPWVRLAHAVTELLLSPGVPQLARFLREATGVLAAPRRDDGAATDDGRGWGGYFDEGSMAEVMRMVEPTLSSLYEEPSVREAGRSLGQLLDARQAWQVYEAFVATRTTDELARAIHDMLREARTAQQPGARGGGRTPWILGAGALAELLRLAEEHGPERVGLAIASYGLAGPQRAGAEPAPEQEGEEAEEGVTV